MKLKKWATVGVLAFGLFVAGCSSSTSESAEDYPTENINLIVPWSAGGDSDVIARIINKYLEEELDTSIVVKNMGGGGGSIGANEALNSDADGYTLLAGHDSIDLSYLLGNTEFSHEEFEPVALMTTANQIIATHKDNEWNNMDEVISQLKEEPESISFGAALGSTSHTLPLGIEDATETTFNIVNYEGTSERTTALLGNHVSLGATTVPAAKEYLESGELKMLGISSEERHESLPDVPTLKEQGIDFINATNRGYFFPKDTPQEIVDKVSEALQKVAENPDFIAEMEAQGVDVNFKNAADYGEWLSSEFDQLESILQRQGLIE
ncbi:tripartite tricarboxylate transporter substrate binding protein [Oceanobacillus bengalensis]|uniref:Tripartite tricarboxylate transporter substrate binding protein n=1 Tax=Oceanobacillus bengalensis TaxID=1435466 RepID=A0A494YSW9_9BACI|nr:tripartite tricarboxylate transporter substrate binding protein [Oceanobacillus bengalensis]RKQ13199.1 tripartite tricarboxylate transporter substrate binding protein [Oceanobacillus bengalensis]